MAIVMVTHDLHSALPQCYRPVLHMRAAAAGSTATRRTYLASPYGQAISEVSGI